MSNGTATDIEVVKNNKAFAIRSMVIRESGRTETVMLERMGDPRLPQWTDVVAAVAEKMPELFSLTAMATPTPKPPPRYAPEVTPITPPEAESSCHPGRRKTRTNWNDGRKGGSCVVELLQLCHFR